MMDKEKFLGIVLFVCLFNSILFAYKDFDQDVPLGWIEKEEVHFSNGLYFLHTNCGVVELKVVDYDKEKGCYLVECIKYGNSFYPKPIE